MPTLTMGKIDDFDDYSENSLPDNLRSNQDSQRSPNKMSNFKSHNFKNLLFKNDFQINQAGGQTRSVVSVLDKVFASAFVAFVPDDVYLRENQIRAINRKAQDTSERENM